MQHLYDTALQFTSSMPMPASIAALGDFAQELGWHPSDSLIDLDRPQSIANVHLVVEHGLENTAVISFLKAPYRYADLDYAQQTRLLSMSYNNLVDWHIQVQHDQVDFVFNRTRIPKVVDRRPLSRVNIDNLRSQTFQEIIGRKPSPNIPALDNAFIETISTWKRSISAEMGYAVSNEDLSALFNAIIFVRAAEDNYSRRSGGRLVQDVARSKRALLDSWGTVKSSERVLYNVLSDNLSGFIDGEIPPYVIDRERLGIFHALSPETVHALLSDFYQNKFAPYEYDFSVISKQALSRIYEHYVSLLKVTPSAQVSFSFSTPLPSEERDKTQGSVYTPQFIARFFARYLKENMSERVYRNLKVADPACGSGIFLRTLLELQCDPLENHGSDSPMNDIFGRVLGIDKDESACQAARLSIALLYLALTGQLPQVPNIVPSDAIEYFKSHLGMEGEWDAIIANPPFISVEAQDDQTRKRIVEFMGEHASGRIDLYLAFLLLGIKMIKPGGYGLFVLPQNFISGKNASGMRRMILKECWVRCLVDLSSIRVFDTAKSYVVLLVIQKKGPVIDVAPAAMIVRCQERVGAAVVDATKDNEVETSYYSTFKVKQDEFAVDNWVIVPPSQTKVADKIALHPKLNEFMNIRQGFISGSDRIFVVPSQGVPLGEEAIFAPALRDREMRAYITPPQTTTYLFYPYINGSELTEEQLRDEFPATWEYLNTHKSILESRGSLRKYNKLWWEPIWPRLPENMLRPKIVSPHLVLVPRFALDLEGKYATSHGPIVTPKGTGVDEDLLKYFVAVLNSTVCYWHIANHSHKFQQGYVKLELKTLGQTPVPDPSGVDFASRYELIRLVDQRMETIGSEARLIERQIDGLVADLYKLSSEERQAVGLV